MTEQDLNDVQALLERSFDVRVNAVEPIHGGGNNRIYRVVADSGVYALKFYPQVGHDPRDRLNTEVSAINFLHANGVAQVPRLIQADSVAGCALYSWVDGTAVDPVDEDALTQMLAFVDRLVSLGELPGAGQFNLASEACLSGRELVRQVETRWDRLNGSADLTSSAKTLLEASVTTLQELANAAERAYADAGVLFDVEIEQTDRVLSPSDFGFHNALRRSNDTITVLDLEYFGWDDPVKLAADFLLHPGMALNSAQKSVFLDGVREIFCRCTAFDVRLRALYPLYALRWMMIIMNEFCPQIWNRRVAAGVDRPRDEILARQLGKAERMFRHAQSAARSFPYDS